MSITAMKAFVYFALFFFLNCARVDAGFDGFAYEAYSTFTENYMALLQNYGIQIKKYLGPRFFI